MLLFLHPLRALHALTRDSPTGSLAMNYLRLNTVLQIYKERNFARVLGSWVALYLL